MQFLVSHIINCRIKSIQPPHSLTFIFIEPCSSGDTFRHTRTQIITIILKHNEIFVEILLQQIKFPGYGTSVQLLFGWCTHIRIYIHFVIRIRCSTQACSALSIFVSLLCFSESQPWIWIVHTHTALANTLKHVVLQNYDFGIFYEML